MRRCSFLLFPIYLMLLVVFASLAGCERMASSYRGFRDSPQARPMASTYFDETEEDQIAASAKSYAQRVARMAQARSAWPPREILWLNTNGKSNTPAQVDATAPKPTASLAAPQTSAETSASQDSATPQDPGPLTQQAEQTQPDFIKTTVSGMGLQLTQEQVYAQLLQAVRSGDDSDLSKALTTATLIAAGPRSLGSGLDRSLLASLSVKERRLIERYHQTVSVLRQDILQGGGRIDQAKVTDRLEELFGQQPITIRTLELCDKVLGFGVYDAFTERVFMAGREQTLIVYVELDHFKTVAREQGDGYEVKLRQELELYESNGFEVWHHEPVQIVDVSRNKRRDFFVVQMVTLPAQLGVGKYHLKVRVFDENAGTRDETSIEIRLVADTSMVRGSGR